MKKKIHSPIQFKSIWTIVVKDTFIYYFKAPVIIYGLIFPGFLFLAFFLGKNVPFGSLLPSVLALTLFFTSSSVDPMIIPWETRTHTLERLVSSPISLEFILWGDIIASFLFGLVITLVLLIFALAFFPGGLVNIPVLLTTIILSGFCFSSLGILLSAPATDNPSNIMMLSNMVRLPLVFISGIFIPCDKLPALGKIIARFSPLTYSVDLLRSISGKEHIFSPVFSLIALLIFTVCFLFLAMFFHKRNLSKRF